MNYKKWFISNLVAKKDSRILGFKDSSTYFLREVLKN
jgi:hypothetical protein